MSYRCLDCSYKAQKKFPGGACPACGSFKIKGSRIEKANWEPERRRRTFLETVLMSLLWAVLLYEAYNRYLSKLFE